MNIIDLNKNELSIIVGGRTTPHNESVLNFLGNVGAIIGAVAAEITPMPRSRHTTIFVAIYAFKYIAFN